MINGFKHKGLKKFYEEDNASGLPASQLDKISRILDILETAEGLEDIAAFPSLDFHPLKGDRKGGFAVKVNANYRITFSVEEGNLLIHINYEDYH
jgi:toxin HigB-1